MNKPTVEATLQLVTALYNGKTDRGGVPKADHVRRVVANLPADASYECNLSAALHDALEDFPLLDAGSLLGLGFPIEVVVNVAMLTHIVSADTYDDYITKLITVGDRNLLLIKLADNTDNICLKRRALLSPEGQAWHIDRCEKVYYPTRKRLLEALERL